MQQTRHLKFWRQALWSAAALVPLGAAAGCAVRPMKLVTRSPEAPLTRPLLPPSTRPEDAAAYLTLDEIPPRPDLKALVARHAAATRPDSATRPSATSATQPATQPAT